MAVYKGRNIDAMMADLSSLEMEWLNSSVAFTQFAFQSEKAKEFSHHGFVRRTKILVRCIKTVFEKLPPNSSDIPDRDDVSDAEIAIHAFIINCFGCIDNLAWVLVEELSIGGKNGRELSAAHIGLQPKYKEVRAALSEEFCAELERLNNWFDQIGRFRHALAHRVAPYIPPHCVTKENAAEYKRLEEAIQAAQENHFAKMEEVNSARKGTGLERADEIGRLIKERDVEADRLEEKKKSLCHFLPVMGHSFYEESPQILFHVQMLTDFKTIARLGNFVMRELEINKHKNVPADS